MTIKLIRDLILVDDGAEVGHVEPVSAAYRELLREKLFEEAGELADADRDDGRRLRVLEEAADVYEVLLSLIMARGRGIGMHRGDAKALLIEFADRRFGVDGGFEGGRTYISD